MSEEEQARALRREMRGITPTAQDVRILRELVSHVKKERQEIRELRKEREELDARNGND